MVPAEEVAAVTEELPAGGLPSPVPDAVAVAATTELLTTSVPLPVSTLEVVGVEVICAFAQPSRTRRAT
jgi:hypothetical protein